MLYKFIRYIALVLFKLFFNIKTFGSEYIPETGPVIIASNHVSYLDPIVLSVASPRGLNFIAKETLFKNKIFGRFLASINVFAVNIENKGSIEVIKEAIRRLKNNKALLIFPEGARSWDGRLKKGEAGVGMLALKTHCPVIPVFIKGTDKALPRGAKFIRLKKIAVYFGKPIISSSEESKDNYRKLTDKIMDEIAKLG